MPDKSYTTILAGCVADIADSKLPQRVATQAMLCVVDFAASVLAGVATNEAVAAQAVLPAYGNGRSTIIANPMKSSVFGAAFYHGLVATIADVDDAHQFASGLHLSATTLPVALALGEELDCSGERVMKAIVAGYEVSSRICLAADLGMRNRGFHSTGAAGPFGACAAACVLLGLELEEIKHALGIAASGAGGIFAFQSEGASVRHTHAAWACHNGLSAALMARNGLTGPTFALEGPDGFLSAYSDGYEETSICSPVPSLSGLYQIDNLYRKLFSACGHALPAITAALDLRSETSFQVEQVEKVVVRGYRAAARLTNAEPRTVGEAKFSMPYIVALALSCGDVSNREMNMEVIRRPDIGELAAKISVIEDPKINADYPRVRSSRIELDLRDGTRLQRYVDAAIGSPNNPATPAQVTQKFVTHGAGLLNAGAITALSNAVENSPTAREIMGMLGSRLAEAT